MGGEGGGGGKGESKRRIRIICATTTTGTEERRGGVAERGRSRRESRKARRGRILCTTTAKDRADRELHSPHPIVTCCKSGMHGTLTRLACDLACGDQSPASGRHPVYLVELEDSHSFEARCSYRNLFSMIGIIFPHGGSCCSLLCSRGVIEEARARSWPRLSLTNGLAVGQSRSMRGGHKDAGLQELQGEGNRLVKNIDY